MSGGCIGTLTIVGQEETPQVGIFQPVDLGPISNRRTFNVGICIRNFRISFRLIMT